MRHVHRHLLVAGISTLLSLPALTACETPKQKKKHQTWAQRQGSRATKRKREDLLDDASIMKFALERETPVECLEHAGRIQLEKQRHKMQLACMRRGDFVDPQRAYANKKLRKLLDDKRHRGVVAAIFAHEGARDLQGAINTYKLPFMTLSQALRNDGVVGKEVMLRGRILTRKKIGGTVFLLVETTAPGEASADNTGVRSVLVGRHWRTVPGEVAIKSQVLGKRVAVRLDKGRSVTTDVREDDDFVFIGRWSEPDPYAVNQRNPWAEEIGSPFIVDNAAAAMVYGEQKLFNTK